MSDVGILNDPVSILEIILLLGSPGILLGALLWRRHRFMGALVGAVIGFVVCLGGWLVFKNVI
jgi:hypothetical protein